MSNDPISIHVDRVVELLLGLGLDPVNPRDIRSVVIQEGLIEVKRYRRDEEDNLIFGRRTPLTEIVTIKIDDDDQDD